MLFGDEPLSVNELSGVAGWIVFLIDGLGSIGVGLVVFLETVFPPIPSEVVLPAAGYLAGTGELSFWATVAWATIGSVAGALVLYSAGATIGEERLIGVASRVPLVSRRDVERSFEAFERWQQPVVFWGRLVPGVRSLVSIPAGAHRMALPRFVWLTASGSLIWNLVLTGSGWWLGDSYGATASVSRWINIVLVGAGLGLVCWLVVKRVRRAP